MSEAGSIAAAAPSDPRRSVRERVFVVGAGIMGSGIAAEAALHGYAVTLEDVSEELAQAGLDRVRAALDGAVAKSAIGAADREEALRNIDIAIGLRRADSAQIVVEAAPEKLALKRTIFQELEAIASPSALFATNTSSLPVTSIAAPLKDPGRVVGIHFFNPVLRMPLVELIPGLSTRPETTARAKAFAERLGKTVGTRPRQPRVRDDPGARGPAQRSRLDALRRDRLSGGHRHRLQARLPPPDGTA